MVVEKSGVKQQKGVFLLFNSVFNYRIPYRFVVDINKKF